jgi:protein SCO1
LRTEKKALEKKATCSFSKGGGNNLFFNPPSTFFFNPSYTPSFRQPVSYASLALTMATGAGIVFYYDYLKQQKVKAALEGANAKGKNGTAATAGAAAIGGPFSLVDSSGKAFTEQNLVGNGGHLLYFGFTRCPDICPDELEKIAAVTNALEKELKGKSGSGSGDGKNPSLQQKSSTATTATTTITPVFISVDPERDPPAHVGAYVKEFHPRMLGLTGTVAQCRAAARAYRVYYARAAASPGGNDDESEKKDGGGKKKKRDEIDEDYLIDHSIITYLIDPKGKFVTFFGKNIGEKEMVESVLARVGEWKEEEEGGGEGEGEKEKK